MQKNRRFQMFCGICGNKIPDEANVCPYCGTKVAIKAAAPANEAPKAAAAQVFNEPQPAPKAEAKGKAPVRMNGNIKNLCTSILYPVIGLFALLTFCFAIVYISYFGYAYRISGFTFLFSGGELVYYSGAFVILIILFWIMFIVALATLAAGIIMGINGFTGKSIMKFDNERKNLFILGIPALGLAVLYLIFGIITVASLNKYMSGLAKTASFWPLIIQLILVGGLVFFNYFVEGTGTAAKAAAAKPQTQPQTQTQTQSKGIPFVKKQDPVEEIKRYKELLDAGAITEEEYEKKKKELLGL